MMRKSVTGMLLAAMAVSAGLFYPYRTDAGERGSAAGASFYSGKLQEKDGTHPAPEEAASEYTPKIEDVHVFIPGMEEERTLVWISDMHICTGGEDPDVTKAHREDAQERFEMMHSPSGLSSNETWDLLSRQVDGWGADYVIFGADMLDYVSQENLAKLQAGLDRIQTPWMYIRADHDYGRWFSDMGIKKMRKLHRSVAPQNKLWCERFGDFTLAGLDNTTSAISDETLEEFRALCEEGIPIILCTHVPFDTGLGDTPALEKLSQECWEGRILCWGNGNEYDTSQGGNMSRLMDMIMAEDSPVAAVLAGHLHKTWDGKLTDRCIGHVFSAAYEDYAGIITVSGAP